MKIFPLTSSNGSTSNISKHQLLQQTNARGGISHVQTKVGHNLNHIPLYAKLLAKFKRSVNIIRLKEGPYDEIVALLEKELELEESDAMPEKRHMVKDCEKQRKKKKMPRKANRLRKKSTLSVARKPARRTMLKRCRCTLESQAYTAGWYIRHHP